MIVKISPTTMGDRNTWLAQSAQVHTDLTGYSSHIPLLKTTTLFTHITNAIVASTKRHHMYKHIHFHMDVDESVFDPPHVCACMSLK